jgi:hypothetical protein
MSMRVICQMTNCLSYVATGVSNDSYCQCKHPDKRHYNQAGTCPLYRADWTKTSAQVKNLREKFSIGSLHKKVPDTVLEKK